MRLLQVLHQDGHHHIDQDELSHQHKHHEEKGGEERVNTTILETFLRVITLLPDGVLHDPVPVVPRGNPKECEEGHSKGSEVSVFPQPLTGMVLVTF